LSLVAKNPKPRDWAGGSTTIGGTYDAWNTYGQGAPDMGVGAGPGLPYHTTKKKVKTPAPMPLPSRGGPMSQRPEPHWNGGNWNDARISAIRKRLGWA
jgi:hypothetical protein